jgi:hydroxyacylglutathione hydrolase
MTLHPIPAFADNYIWLLHAAGQALVVDPGEAQPVLDTLARLNLRLDTILITHHHSDHVGGVDQLRQLTGAKVYGPAREKMPEPLQRLKQDDTVQALGLTFEVIDVPGHTAGHIAYFCPELSTNGVKAPLLFCGDTLFSGGCGRLFEGTPAQMLASLDALAHYPGNTQVCCTHEYTLSNLRFAVALEPDNAALAHYQANCLALRQQGLPTLPSTLAQELKINPFLRTRQSTVIQAAERFQPSLASAAGAHDAIAVFAAVREWKNQFK